MNLEERVLILAPSGQDASLAASVLKNEGLEACICADMDTLCTEFQAGAGVLLISEEALTFQSITALKAILAHQETWSDIPVTLLTMRNDERKSFDLFNIFGLEANVNLLERTFRPLTLISVVRANLRARRRQYEVRNLVEKLKRSAEDLQRSNQELEQFAYVSSHDLQEPLRTITSYTDLILLQQKEKLDEKAVKYLDYLQEGALHAQELIQGLLGYASITKRNYPFEEHSLESLLKQAISHLQNAIQESEAVITYDPLPVLKVNGLQITQLFQNLISNGIKYRRKNKPQVHIAAAEEAEKWVFSVKDNGIGIEPQFKERIFMIFKRLHSKNEYPGTGLGLAICKKIVEQHGGEIWLESAPQKGSTFYFSLPVQNHGRG